MPRISHAADPRSSAPAPPLLAGFLEARSLGVLNIERLLGAKAVRAHTRLDLIIRLDLPRSTSEPGAERLHGRRGERDVCGRAIPMISIPIRLGQHLATLVELACADQRLRTAGYHADVDFAARQSDAMNPSGSRAP